MSQHPSLKSSSKSIQHRSVLKRAEKIKILKEKGEWKEEDSVLGLPKVKTLRFKIKKEKAAPSPEAAETAGTTAEGAEKKEAPAVKKTEESKKGKKKK